MPGPVSDTMDPEFGTGANASDVLDGMREVRDLLTQFIGTDRLEYIVAVAQRENGEQKPLLLSERQARILRFSVDRAMESV